MSVIVAARNPGDVAVDPRRTEMLFVRRPAERDEIVRLFLSSGRHSVVCAGPDTSAAWRIGSPSYAPDGSAAAFVGQDILGQRKVTAFGGAGPCIAVADGVTAARFGPGKGRVVVSDGRSAALVTMPETLDTLAYPARLPPIIDARGGEVIDLDVDDTFGRFAVLRESELAFYRFGSRVPDAVVDLGPMLEMAGLSARPGAVAFAPDDRYAAVIAGDESAARAFVLSTDGSAIDGSRPFAPMGLAAPPALSRPDWVPALMTPGGAP
ncbi:hypothetical protein K8I61_10370 [bacterium]|nr:hypothetical protein [bacterium]